MNKRKVDRPFAKTGVAGKEPLRKRGQVLLLSALMMPVLCGMMGFAVDLGVLYNLRRQMQTATDAGAAAGAYDLKRGASNSEIIQAAKGDVALNGFNGSRGEAIMVNRPPTSGSYAGDSDFVEVLINENAPTYFMRILGIRSARVGARAVGGLVNNGTACVYVLDPHQRDACLVGGGGMYNLSCGLIVNSDDTRALSASGGSVVTASYIGVRGGYVAGGGGYFDPVPNTGVAKEDDPLAHLQPPSFGGCNYQDYKIPSGGSAILSPGVYCGGIEIPGGAQAYFNPGTYILLGGGLKAGGGPILEGHGVSFYNTGTYGGPKNQQHGAILIGGGGTANLSAPTTGPLAGVLFFQDRNAPTDIKNDLSGGSDAWFDGAVYFPTQKLRVGGGGSFDRPSCMTLVVRLLEFSGGSMFIDNSSPGCNSPPPPIKKPVLVE